MQVTCTKMTAPGYMLAGRHTDTYIETNEHIHKSHDPRRAVRFLSVGTRLGLLWPTYTPNLITCHEGMRRGANCTKIG